MTRHPREWSVAEWVVRWSAFAAMCALAVPVERVASFFTVVSGAAGLLAEALHGIVDWIATRMVRVIGLGDE
jgi:hypothetical protein